MSGPVGGTRLTRVTRSAAWVPSVGLRVKGKQGAERCGY